MKNKLTANDNEIYYLIDDNNYSNKNNNIMLTSMKKSRMQHL